MKMRVIRSVMYVCLITSFITGCQAKKTSTVNTGKTSSSGKTGEIVKVENAKGDLEKIVSLFMGKTLEDAIKDGAEYDEEKEYLSYSNNTEKIIYSDKTYLDYKLTKRGPSPEFLYKVNYGRAGDKYSVMIDKFTSYHVNTTIDCGLRQVLPDEELENCSRDEVLGYCKPYAEVLGYGDPDCEVQVYAMTLDRLKNTNAPDYMPDYEALYLVYKPIINGLLMESTKCMLEMVYVPEYGKIVSASGTMPWAVKEITESGPLISEDEAVSATMNINNIPDKKDIEVMDVELAYSQSFDKREGSNDTLVLCWRVNYKRLNLAEYSGDRAYCTELLDAVSGEECETFPGLSD